jgi:basic membrane protein A
MLGAGKWAIGAETDQAVALPKYAGAILTSVEKVVDVAVLDAINRNAAGEQGGEDLVGTLANGGVRIAPFHDLDSEVPGDLRAAADQLALDIASGAIRLGDYLK